MKAANQHQLGAIAHAIRGAGGKGGGGGGEAPDSVRSTQIADTVDLLGEGELEGLTHGLKSIYFDGVPLKNEDGSFNFEGVQVTVTLGTQGQASMTGADGVQVEVPVSVEVVAATPVVRTITNPEVDTARVTIMVPQLSETDTTNGDVKGSSFEWAIDVQSDGGGFVEVMHETVAEKTMSRWPRAKRFALPGNAPWDIRVRRISPDAAATHVVNAFAWSSYTEIQSVKLRHPNAALVRTRVNAKQFSRIPVRSFDVMGLRVQVPTNYDPMTKVYTGVWDGTFKIAWTDCPAWVFYAVVTNRRYGLGRYFTSGDALKWELYRIGRYCDEMVSNGRGGLEPRFRCGVQLTTREQAYKVITDLAAIFRGMAYWMNTDVSVVQDAPSDPVALFTPANVVGGKFSYSTSSHSKRPSQVTVWFNDLAQHGKLVPELVVDKDFERRYGVRPMKDLSPLGVWSRAQARRAGLWALYSERMEGEAAAFSVGLDGVLVPPGAVFQIADPNEAGERLGGRVRSATTAAVSLDHQVTLASGESYTLTVMLQDPANAAKLVPQTRPVTTAAGAASVLAVFPAFTAAPAAQTVWVLQSNAVQATTWRCLGVKEVDGKNEFEIAALRHHPQKYALIDADVEFEPAPVSRIQVVPGKPEALVLLETVYSVGSAKRSRVTMSWEEPAAGLTFLVSWRLNGSTWVDMPMTSSNTVDVDGLAPGLLEVTVRSRNVLARTSPPVAEDLVLTGNATPSMQLVASTGAFTFNAAGAPKPAGQTIVLTARPMSLAGAVTFTATGYDAAGASLGALTLTGTGDSRSLSIAAFGAAISATVVASIGAYSATLTLSRLGDGQIGAPGVSAPWLRVRGSNTDANNAGHHGHGIEISDGTTLAPAGRGHWLTWIDATTMTVLGGPTRFDTYASPVDIENLAAELAWDHPNVIAVLYTYDASSCPPSLRTALRAWGSGLLTTWGPERRSHVFIGQRGLQPAQAYEAEVAAADASGIVMRQAYFTSSGLVRNGAVGTPGDPGAGIFTWITSGTAIASGNSIEKVGGTETWGQGDGYSAESYAGGAFASASAAQANKPCMFGLNSDPGTDSDYSSLDYAWYFRDDGEVMVYESGSGPDSFGTYTPSTVCAVLYNNKTIRYLKDGVVVRTVATTPGRRFHLDTSFYAPGVKLKNVSFGPAGAEGDAGANGLTVAKVQIYRRATSAPALPSSTITVTLATGAVSGLNNGWSVTVPAGADPLYTTIATAAGTGSTDNIEPGEWPGAEVMARDGEPGAPALNSAPLILYLRTDSADPPALPSASITYTFATGIVAGVNNGWSQSMPTSGGRYRWFTNATAKSYGATDTIGPSELAGAALLAQDGEPGTPGINGLTVNKVQIYRRASSAPALPSSTVTVTLASGSVSGLNNGWTVTIPAGTDPLYTTLATAAGSGTTDTIEPGEWPDAVILARDGGQGADGLNRAPLLLFQRTDSASAPALPSAAITFTFATGIASGVNNGWSQTLPTTGGRYRWFTSASAFGYGTTDVINPGELADAALLAEDGSAGQDAVSFSIDRRSVLLTADSLGVVDAGQSFAVAPLVQRGSADDTSNWVITYAASSGVSASQAGNVVSITSLASGTESGTVTIKANRTGFPEQQAMVAVAKTKRAVPASGPAPGGIFGAAAQSTSTADASCRVEFRDDGTIWSYSTGVNGFGVGYLKVGDWYLPSGGSVGAGFAVDFGIVSSEGLTGGLTSIAGVLSTTRYAQLTTTENGTNYRKRFLWYRIYASGGSGPMPTLQSGNIGLDSAVEA